MALKQKKNITKRDIRDLSFEEVKAYLLSHKEESFRATQVYTWLYKKNVAKFNQMRNLSAPMRELLERDFELFLPRVVKKQKALDETLKVLLELEDGQSIETVYIPTRTRLTVCVSTQVGCKYGCRFCASGMAGFIRDLKCSEIVNQVLSAQRFFADKKATHIVFMGMGEPLDNYHHLMKAIHILNDAQGVNIGIRRMTISTCGVIPGISDLSREGLQFELAISLHGYDNASRGTLMPVNQKYPFDELIKAARTYYQQTKRLVTFEYVLIRGITCTDNAVHSLKSALVGFDCKLNLIPYNPVNGLAYEAPHRSEILSFQSSLLKHGIKSTIRHSRGRDVSASCGQLKRAVK